MKPEEVVAAIAVIVQAEWPDQMPGEGLRPETELFYRGLGLDSIDGVTLLLALEERFGMELNQDEMPMEAFETVGSLASFIVEQRDARP